MDPRNSGLQRLQLLQGPQPEWQQWNGWMVRTHHGNEVGALVGRFDGGLYDGRLRVLREVPGGIAVFAVPLSAIATVDSGTLSPTAFADILEWLVYLVRRHLSEESA